MINLGWLIMIAGCANTPVTKQPSCQFGVNFSLSEKLTHRNEIDYGEIESFVSNNYNSNMTKNINVTLLKAYVRFDKMIIKATTVISEQADSLSPKNYFRATEVDTNIIGLAAESQLALEQSLAEAIDKALADKKDKCLTAQ